MRYVWPAILRGTEIYNKYEEFRITTKVVIIIHKTQFILPSQTYGRGQVFIESDFEGLLFAYDRESGPHAFVIRHIKIFHKYYEWIKFY